MLDRRVASMLLCGSCLTIGSARAQTVLREWRGATQGDALGLGLADLGDVDRDGVDDFAIGVPGDDTVGADRGKVVIRSGADGHEILSLQGGHYDKRYGAAVVALGDVDLDGIPDLLIGSTAASAPATATAYVSRYSARSAVDGSPLWSFDVPAGQYGTTTTVAALGDCNLDGRREVAISMPGLGTPALAGRIVVLSGLDGSILQQITGPEAEAEIGIGLSAAGDLDADGRADWWNTRNHNFFYNFAQARSGLDGHVLFEIAQPYIYESDYAINLVGGNDIDGDAIPDLVVSIPVTPGYGLSGPGHVYAYSGASHALLWHRQGASNAERIGWWIGDVGDLDGDGVRDLGTSAGYPLTSSYGGVYTSTNSNALFLSGASGVRIGGLTLAAPELNFSRVLAAGDVDGDGHADVLYGAVTASYVASQPVYTTGIARVVTLVRVGLKADRVDLDHETGGTQVLTLDFGPAFAGRSYRVLGSKSGTQPGITTSAGIVPLAVDPYFVRTLRAPGDPHLSSGSGTLDAEGRATASFTLPAGSMRFPRDSVVHHAAVVLNAAGTSVSSISRAVPLLVTVDPCHADPSAADDCDGDGVRDGCQTNSVPSSDCNHNARPDACDIASGASQDCDGDHVPDDCQSDCNHNGRADTCDIALGSSSDCDQNGQPDECTTYYYDQNQNGVPDACESVVRYVDDDALGDPGPGTTILSDPLEDGTPAHPFDSLAEAVQASGANDQIVVEDGLYTGSQNRSVYAVGHVGCIRSRNGPDTCQFDLELQGGCIQTASSVAVSDFRLEGITFVHSAAVVYSYGDAHAISATGDVVVRNCRFIDGQSWGNPGLSITVAAGHSALVEHCQFLNNVNLGSYSELGAALRLSGSNGTCVVRNCLFVGNGSLSLPTFGQAVLVASKVTLDHCTFHNGTLGTLAAVRLKSSTSEPASLVLADSILQGVGAASPVVIDGLSQCAVRYCVLNCPPSQLGAGISLGLGVIQASPQFVHAAGGEFHLQPGSPCVDAGDPAFVPSPHERDGDGEARVWNGRTDVGWDERH